jgi:hypothetical protein
MNEFFRLNLVNRGKIIKHQQIFPQKCDVIMNYIFFNQLNSTIDINLTLEFAVNGSIVLYLDVISEINILNYKNV